MQAKLVQSGVLLAIASFAAYSWADAIIKGLGHGLSVYEMGVAYTAIALIPMLLTKPAGERVRDTFRFRHPLLMPAILVLRTTSSVSVTYAFTAIPLAEAYCIIFLIPVFITGLSVLLLKEEVRVERWLLIALSFAGVLLVVRPGFRALEFGHLAALVCACADAGATTLTRFVAREERRITLIIAPTICTFTFNLIMMLVTGFIMPTPWQLGMLLVLGLLCGVAYTLYVTAVATTQASRIAPMLYSQIAWALILGATFFHEIPDGLAIAGLVVIVAAGVGSVFVDGARGRFHAYAARRRGAVPEEGPVARPPEV